MTQNEFKTIIKFIGIEQAAEYFLTEAFRCIHQAAYTAVAGILFRESLMSVEPDPDYEPPRGWGDIAEYLGDRDRIAAPTEQRIFDCWESAQRDAYDSEIRLEKDQKFESTDVLGHIIFLATFVEATLNRHLLWEREHGGLETSYYKKLDRTDLIVKLLFCFRDKIDAGEIHTDRIQRLVSLRNKAVHYRDTSVETLSLTSEELQGIWSQLGSLLNHTKGKPGLETLDEFVQEFITRWIRPTAKENRSKGNAQRDS